MFLTTFNDIKNVWFNDSHITVFFITLFFLPFFLVLFVKNFYKIIFFRIKEFVKVDFFSIIKEFYIEIIFIFVFFSYILSIVGLFQFKFTAIIDSIVRAIGVICYISGIIIFYLFNRRHSEIHILNFYNKGFYSMVRHPYYSILLLISFSFCLKFVSFLTLLLTIILLISIVVRIKIIEKELEKRESFFIDYKYSVPMLFPSIKKIFKSF